MTRLSWLREKDGLKRSLIVGEKFSVEAVKEC